MNDEILAIENLTIKYITDDAVVEAVNNVSFSIKRGQVLGLVGETGAGKTTTALGIMRLIPTPPGKVASGEIFFEGEDLYKKSAVEMRKIRGSKISMIFQDPMTSLNPIFTVGEQIAEVIKLHEKISDTEAAKKAAKMLELVGIKGDRYDDYPHQFSGGMKQRVVIAISLACSPTLLIADEPTTALDVTIQAQVMELMNKLKKDFNTSMLMITHDLGIVAEMCDQVAIMYAGEIVEIGASRDIFENHLHPYTGGLFGSIPNIYEDTDRLKPIDGLMPDPANLPDGCSFCDRCPKRMPVCEKTDPAAVEISASHKVKCHLYASGREGQV